MAEPSAEQLRKEIALQLKQHERDLAMADTKPPLIPMPDPHSYRPKEPGDPGPPLAAPPPKADPNAVYVPEAAGWAGNEGKIPAGLVGGVKGTARGTLAAASGGGTEAVADAVAGAKDKAAGEVEAATLETKSPEDMVRLMIEAGVLPPEQQQAAYAVIKPHWQPGTRTNAMGATGKDPNAVRAAMELQGVSEEAQAKGLQQTQKADSSNYDMLQQVQKNEMDAIKSFKNQHDAMQARYEGERQAQINRLGGIQKAMDAVPDAPRTIRQKMDRSGFSDKTAMGLAAAFSVLGGATLRDGGRSVQTFLGNMQANIDREVQKEADEYARLGDRAKLSNNIFANMRQGMQDDVAAMNLTKALYYEAAANTVQQIATQYKMDTQSVQVQQLIAHLAEKRKELILDTAQTVQEQTSQTDKFNPGGVVQVGGGVARRDPNEYKSNDLDKDTNEYGKELEKRGFNMGERAMALYQQALDKMRKAGFKNDESFKRAFITLSDPQASTAKQAAVLVSLGKEEREALQYIVSANKEQLKDAAGRSVTANELVRDVIEKGGYSPESLEQVRQVLAANREQIQNATAGGFDPRVVSRYHARKDLAGIERKFSGIGTNQRQPIDPKDLRTQIKGQLNK